MVAINGVQFKEGRHPDAPHVYYLQASELVDTKEWMERDLEAVTLLVAEHVRFALHPIKKTKPLQKLVPPELAPYFHFDESYNPLGDAIQVRVLGNARQENLRGPTIEVAHEDLIEELRMGSRIDRLVEILGSDQAKQWLLSDSRSQQRKGVNALYVARESRVLREVNRTLRAKGALKVFPWSEADLTAFFFSNQAGFHQSGSSIDYRLAESLQTWSIVRSGTTLKLA